ncbi:MAG: polyphosphate kinase 2 family protein [Planctomycetes bacterium]|nr:polyphosphate kinase 2 family protein [Planctomycetota bacterium]
MASPHRFEHDDYRIAPGSLVRLDEHPTKGNGDVKRTEAEKALAADVSALVEAQRLLWAAEKYALLIILQGMDASGKDGAIRHVMSGINPQGCNVHSFKTPNDEELRHHFLWRPARVLPGRGRIGIFNRSYYEEVLVVRVHPELLEPQNLPARPPFVVTRFSGSTTLLDAPPGPPEAGHDEPDESLWQSRFEDINAFEHMLVRNGTCILKFFLHLSKGEQKKRFLKRLNNAEKHWKFNARDIHERRYWDKYHRCYEAMLTSTSTEWAPWHVIPADRKWFARAVIADIIAASIEQLDLKYPVVSDEDREALEEGRRELEAEETGRRGDGVKG